MAKDEVIERPIAMSATSIPAQPGLAKAARGRAYESDVYGWAIDQAAHVRASRYDFLDVENVAEEIESLGRREFEVLVGDLEIIIQHMLKWDHQAERRAGSWTLSIAEHRDRVACTIDDSPSLIPRRDEALKRAYTLARYRAAIETDALLSTFPEDVPYIWTEIVERPFVHGLE